MKIIVVLSVLLTQPDYPESGRAVERSIGRKSP